MEYRTITPDELKQILSRHAEWLKDPSKGERANLRSADLRFSNLRSADLRFSNLSSADLRSANLSSADLRFSNLSSADLRFSNLSSADLRSADLSSADLRSVDLRSVGLLIFQFQRQTAYFTLDGALRIGCYVMPISEWLLGYEEIGRANDYTEAQIEAYGDFIKLCAKQFDRIAKEGK